MVARNSEAAGAVIIPESITYNGETYSVTAIADDAFYKCKDITSVSMPASLIKIGINAFWDCEGLESINIPNSVTTIDQRAFYECKSLKSILIPPSVTSIGDNAFGACYPSKIAYPQTVAYPFSSGVVISYPAEDAIIEDGFLWNSDRTILYYAPIDITGEYSIPASVTSIGYGAFYNCGLTGVNIPNSVTSIGDYAFSFCKSLESAIIPNSVNYLGEQAFAYCNNLKSVELSNSIASLEDRTFYGCGLTSIVIPESVTTIASQVFENCKRLKNVTLGTSITTIDNYAFNYCTALTSISFPNSVTNIGYESFGNCESLTSVMIPPSVTSMHSRAFYDCYNLVKIAYPSSLSFTTNYNTIVYDPDEVIIEDGWIWSTDRSTIYYVPTELAGEYMIPETVTSVGYVSFAGCSELTSVSIPASVNTLVAGAFAFCPSLSTVSLGSGVQEIGASAFFRSALSEVVLSPSVEKIGYQAFSSCQLKHVVIGPNIREIGDKAFDANNNLESIFITAKTPPTASASSFDKYESTLYVSDNAAIEAFGASEPCWNLFTNKKTMIPAESIELESPETIKLAPGESSQIKASVAPADATLPYIFWKSTNPEVAVVGNTGLVTYVGNETTVEECKIIGETLYADGPVIEVTVVSASAGLDGCQIDNNAAVTGSYTVYNLQGICVMRTTTYEDLNNLSPGLYIVDGKKVFIK